MIINMKMNININININSLKRQPWVIHGQHSKLWAGVSLTIPNTVVHPKIGGQLPNTFSNNCSATLDGSFFMFVNSNMSDQKISTIRNLQIDQRNNKDEGRICESAALMIRGLVTICGAGSALSKIIAMISIRYPNYIDWIVSPFISFQFSSYDFRIDGRFKQSSTQL
jgi:hypothetical protein